MKLFKTLAKILLSFLLFFVYIFYILPASLFRKGNRSYENFIFEKRPGGSYFFDRNVMYGKRELEEM